MALAFSLYSFSVLSFPLSPVLSALALTSALLRVFMTIQDDQQTIQALKRNRTDPEEIRNKAWLQTKAHLNTMNQIILSHGVLPLMFFLLLTQPIPIALLGFMGALLLHQAANHFGDDLTDWIFLRTYKP